MIEFAKKFVKNKILLIIVLTVPAFASLIRPGFFPMHDDLQAFRIYEMDQCFKNLQIPCRWVPDMGYKYGYPQFNYYPPSVYYLGESFHLLGIQFIDSVKIVLALGFIFSALAMYLFLKEYLSKTAGLIGALLYTYIPYKAVNVYVRGALNEFWCLVFYPLLFWSSWKLIKEGGKKNLVFFAVSIALLLLTHNVMTLIFLPVLGFWILLQIILEKKYKSIVSLIGSGILGVCLAAFFTLPVFFEKPYAHLETLVGGYFDYRQHFVNVSQLFISNFWGYGSSVWGNDDGLSLSTGQIQFLASVIALVLALFNFKKFKKLSITVFSLFGLELGVLFMVHQKSAPVWTIFESALIFVQFPWRFLSISVFLLGLLSAIGIYMVEKLDFKIFKLSAVKIYGTVLIIACLILYLPFFTPREWYNITDRDKFSGISWQKQLTISIFDYLPIYAKFPPTDQAPENPETLEGLADFKSSRVGSNYKEWQVNVAEPSVLRAPVFDFPGMTVYIDKKVVSHVNNDCRNQTFCLGLVTFPIQPGSHEILVRLNNTPIRTAANIITAISALAILIWLSPKPKYLKKWLD